MTYNDHRIRDIGKMIDEFQIDAGVVEIVLQACHTFKSEQDA